MHYERRPAGFDPGDVAPPPLDEGPGSVLALALDVAGRCNLACRYCAEAATQPPRRAMTQETLEAAWRFLFADDRRRKGFSIRLGSGEPLLALPLLRRLADLVKGVNGCRPAERPAVFLTTNGTLMDSEVGEWLVSTGWHVKLSLDGPKCVHDKWRVTHTGAGTFDRVADAVATLAQHMQDRLSVTAVLCRGANPEEVFDSIADLGVRRIELVPVAHLDECVLPGLDDIESYREFVKKYAHRCVGSAALTALPVLVRFESCVARVMGYGTRRVPCGAGRSLVGVGPAGDLYPCFRFVGLPAHRLGHVSTGLDTEAAAAFQDGHGRAYQRRTPCGTCWAAPLCGGPCFAVAKMFGPGDGRPLSVHCAYAQADARSAVWLVNQLRQRDSERLLAFLPGAIEI